MCYKGSGSGNSKSAFRDLWESLFHSPKSGIFTIGYGKAHSDPQRQLPEFKAIHGSGYAVPEYLWADGRLAEAGLFVRLPLVGLRV